MVGRSLWKDGHHQEDCREVASDTAGRLRDLWIYRDANTSHVLGRSVCVLSVDIFYVLHVLECKKKTLFLLVIIRNYCTGIRTFRRMLVVFFFLVFLFHFGSRVA